MSDPIKEIQELAGKIAESEGTELIDLEFKPGKTRSLLRLYIDKKGGVTVNDCESVSRQLSAVLDVKDLLKNAYVLEVSSPGLDRPLKTERDYERALGRMLRVTLVDEQGKTDQITGKLLETTEDMLVLQQDGRNTRIPRGSIKRAVQDIVLGQPKKKLKRR